MNSQEILAALVAARTFKPEIPNNAPVLNPIRNETSFVSMYDELDRLDVNPFATRTQEQSK